MEQIDEEIENKLLHAEKMAKATGMRELSAGELRFLYKQEILRKVHPLLPVNKQFSLSDSGGKFWGDAERFPANLSHQDAARGVMDNSIPNLQPEGFMKGPPSMTGRFGDNSAVTI